MSANVNNVLQRFLDTNKPVLDKFEGHHRARPGFRPINSFLYDDKSVGCIIQIDK